MVLRCTEISLCKNNIFLKSLNSLDLPVRAAAVGFAEILIPQHAEYLLHHLMSKHATPMGDLHHEDAEIRCVLPTVRSSSSLCLKGLVHISCLGSTIQSVEGVTQHLLLFPGWMKAQVFLAESLGL